MKPNLAYLIFAICVSSLFFSLNVPVSFIDDLIDKVNAKREAALKENLFIHTDRDSYNHGDTLWLKGYINKFSSGMPSEISQTVYVDIINQYNKKILSQEFYNDQGKIDGAFNLPNDLDDGEYNLVAYTSTMKNYSEQWYFTKPLYLKNLNLSSQIIPNLNVKIAYNKKEYKSGDDVVAKLSFIKKADDQFNKTIIEYTIKSKNETIKSFKGEAINAGDIHIRFKIPENTNEISIQAKIKNRDQSLSYASIVPIKSNNIIVSFFPEGGEITRNIKNKIAFQSTDSLGNGVEIAGHLVDENGKQVTNVATEFNGLGAFTFVPVNSKTYSLSVDNRLFPLPKINNNGIVLSVEHQTKDVLSIRVSSSLDEYQNIYITATMRDKIYWGIKGQVQETAMIQIPLKKIPKGILQITLFDNTKQPMAERLSFVNKHKKLNIEVIPHKPNFQSRDSISLKIIVRDHLNKPVQSELSLAAKDILFDTNKQNPYHADIDNYLSFSSQLRGDWKQEINNLPIWNEEKTERVIDLMLLTYGWRKFEWDRLLERDTLINYELINGRVTKGRKKSYGNIPVHMISFGTGNMLITNSDSLGFFSFNKVNLNKSSNAIAITSFLDQNSSRLAISITHIKDHSIPNFTHTITDQISYQSDLFSKERNLEVLNFAHSQLLQEIIIKEKKLTHKEDPSIKIFRGSNVSSKRGEELIPSGNIVSLIRQVALVFKDDAVNRKVFLRAGRSKVGALFVVNGFEMGNNYSRVSHLSPDNIEYLSVLKGSSATALYGNKAADGVVFITTKFVSNYNEPKTSKNIAFLKGYAKHKVFYSPQYKTEKEKSDPFPDFRKTIYWNPKIVTNENGEAIVNYYNADRHSTINISVQGMSYNGLYGSTSTSYKVLPTNK